MDSAISEKLQQSEISISVDVRGALPQDRTKNAGSSIVHADVSDQELTTTQFDNSQTTTVKSVIAQFRDQLASMQVALGVNKVK
jgi:hypothetical protein